MMFKWNRETFLVSFTLVTILFALFYFGNQYFIDPVRDKANATSLLVSEQETVLANYPPSDELLREYENEYSGTSSYLPLSDEANVAMVTLKTRAAESNVDVQTISRVNDLQEVETVPAPFVKATYQAEVTSDSSDSIRQLIDLLMNEERVWNITAFGYNKLAEADYSGTFTFELFYYTDSME